MTLYRVSNDYDCRTQRTYLQANRRYDPGPKRGSDVINHLHSDHETNLSVTTPPLFQIEPCELDLTPRKVSSTLVGDSGEGESGVCNEVDVETSSLEQSQKSRTTTVHTEVEGDIENEEQSGFEIVTAAFGQSRRNGQVPFYSGERI